MTIKKQFETIKQNWLLIAAIFVLVIFMSNFGSIGQFGGYPGATEIMDMAYAPKAMYAESESYRGGGMYNSDFAPEVEERMITKTASMSTEVERGTYSESETKLKAILTTSESFILNENVNVYGEGRTSYKHGYYSIKVETSKYSAILSQLKEIGEVKSFNENARDETGRYVGLQDQLTAEKERLKRYKQMYAEAEEVNDKINLNDRIFNQERTIKYLEDAIENIDKRVDYSTISFTMTEERSGYANVMLVKLSSLIKGFVDSVNSLLSLVFWIIPWLIAILLGKWLWKKFK